MSKCKNCGYMNEGDYKNFICMECDYVNDVGKDFVKKVDGAVGMLKAMGEKY